MKKIPMTSAKLKIIICFCLCSLFYFTAHTHAESWKKEFIGGTVLSNSGEAMKNCFVIVTTHENENPEPATKDTFSTNFKGNFAIPTKLILNKSVTISIAKSGYATEWIHFNKMPEDRLQVLLKPEAKIMGTLLDHEKNALTNYQIIAESIKNPRMRYFTKTQKDGTFEIAGVGKGEYDFKVKAPDDFPIKLKNPPNLKIDFGKNSENQKLQAEPSFSLKGQVTNLTTGKPVKATLWVSTIPALKPVETDENGNYEIKRISRGWHLVQCGAVENNFVSVPNEQAESVGFPGTMQVLIRKKTLSNMNFRLAPGCELTGTLLTPENKPLSGYKVYINNDEPSLSRIVRRRIAQSDKDGKFIFRGLPAGTSFYCLIQKEEETDEQIQFTTGRFQLTLENSHKNIAITVK